MDVPVAFAFAAGLVATINPCGFAMLPAYLSYFIGLDDDVPAGRGTSTARGLVTGLVVSAGFLVVFGLAGTLVTLGVRSVIDVIPWIALVVGLALVGLGGAMLVLGYQPAVTLPHLDRGGRSRRYRSMFLFGISYAVASLSCALPVFLSVVGVAQTAPTFLEGVATFLVYGLGMAMLMIVLTLALALARDGVVRRIRAVLPYIGRISGAVLVLAGAYIAVFWAANLQDPLSARGSLFRSVDEVQTWVSGQFGTRPELWATLFGLVIAATVTYVAWSWRRRAPASPPG